MSALRLPAGSCPLSLSLERERESPARLLCAGFHGSILFPTWIAAERQSHERTALASRVLPSLSLSLERERESPARLLCAGFHGSIGL